MSFDRPSQRRLDRVVEAALGCAIAAVLFAMMVLTCVDVVGRYFFNAPLHGGLEVTELLLAATIFLALPLVTLRDEHVAVDVLDALTPPWLLRTQHIASCLIGAGALAVLAWQLWVRGERLLRVGQTTSVLEIKLAPIAYGMSVLVALTAAVLLLIAWRAGRRAARGGD